MPQMVQDPTAKYAPESPQIPSPFSMPTIKLPIASREYNNNWVFRKAVVKGVRLHMQHHHVASGVFILGPFLVKFGPTVQLSEALTLRFVRQHTSIPVPMVYCAFQHLSYKYIIMQRIDGEEIGKGWVQRPYQEKKFLLHQLRGYIEQLRSIPHPHRGRIAASDMGSLFDTRIFKGNLGYGPFAKEHDFHLFLRYGLTLDHDILKPDSWLPEDERQALTRMVQLQDQKLHRVVFTHGDLNSSNILVKKGKIVALIDFEMSGWYPEYWEYTSAINVNNNDGFWKEEVPKFLDVYEREVEMENTRREHFGPEGYRGRYVWW